MQRDSRRHGDQPQYGHAAPEALGRVIEAWIAHFQAVAVSVRPIRAIEEERWGWHIGLDAESTAILNDLWRGEEVEAGRMRRLLALFRLDFPDEGVVRAGLAGRPVYLAVAANDDDVVRVKPQNCPPTCARAHVKPILERAKRAAARGYGEQTSCARIEARRWPRRGETFLRWPARSSAADLVKEAQAVDRLGLVVPEMMRSTCSRRSAGLRGAAFPTKG